MTEQKTDMNQKTSEGRVMPVCRALVSIAFFLLFTILFYRQAVQYNDKYVSDLPSHISFGINGKGYSLLYAVIGILMRLTRSELSVALLESMFLIYTWRITYKIMMDALLDQRLKDLLFFVSLGLLFLTSIYIPGIYEQFYMKSVITQPWHSITYFGMRLMALVTMGTFFQCYDHYLKSITIRQWCSIAIPLAVSASIKPNFLIAFAFTLLIILIKDFIKTFSDLNAFINIVKMGTVVFPACLVLLFQAIILYRPDSSGEASGIALIWYAFFQNSISSIVLRFICGITFPAAVYIYNRKKLSKKEKFVFLLYIVTFIQMIMLRETGPRAGDNNFVWGIFNSAYILFVYSVSLFISNILSAHKGEAVTKQYIIAGKLVLSAHLITGVIYFLYIFGGGRYAI